MANPMTSAQFVRLLDNRLTKVFEGEIKELPPSLDQFFTRVKGDSAWQEYFEVGNLGDIPVFNGKLTYDAMSPGYYTKIEPKEYAGGIMFERKLLADKKYPVLDNRVGLLTNSAKRTMDKIASGIFTGAFSSAFTFMTSEEGLSMCNDAHTTKSGVSTSTGFDNAGTSALSKTSVAATRLAMRRFKDDRGNRIEINPDTLIVPDNLYDTAMEIVGSQKDPTSANNTVNMNYNRFKVIPYLRLDDNSTTSWFMVDSSLMKRFQVWIDREAPSSQNTVDFETFVWKFSVYFRIGYGFLNWRHCYGHSV